MPGWVQFDRPQRCWFWLLYSCVHRCAAAAQCHALRAGACVRFVARAEGCRATASVLQDASYSFFWCRLTPRSGAQPSPIRGRLGRGLVGSTVGSTRP